MPETPILETSKALVPDNTIHSRRVKKRRRRWIPRPWKDTPGMFSQLKVG
jgi:hypothetical protein